MKKTITAIALASLLALAGQAFGTICAIDNVPAATLLIPYFEVAGCDATAATTLFSINNASATPALAHVTLWTDWTVPGIDFDVYLTGYDVQVIDVRAIFCDGTLPSTGSAVSNLGAFSVFGTFPGCNATTNVGDPPVYPSPAISANFQAHLQAWFSGQASPVSGDCAGSGSQGGNWIGYITVDNDTACNVNFPSEAAYYTNGYLSLNNQLWGDYVYLDAGGNLSEAFAAVHLEADASLTGLTGGPTFYGRYNSALAGFEYSDGREPLPTTYGARYNVTGALGGFSAGTWFYIWREADESAAAVSCGTVPGWWPLDTIPTNALVAFDEAENPVTTTVGPSGEPLPPDVNIPNEANCLQVGSGLPTPWTNGWYYINLSNTVAPTASNSAGQAYMTVVQRLNDPAGLGQFSGGWDAVALNLQCPATTVFALRPTGTLNPGP